ncbi:MAG: hypothetical protein Q4C47_04825, partial [Planctomycetia bacterium]|nr:hypothetical protein [Planctomycetia bacterium]
MSQRSYGKRIDRRLLAIATMIVGITGHVSAQTFTRADPSDFAQDPTVFAWGIERVADAGVTDLSKTLAKPAGRNGFVRCSGHGVDVGFETDAGPVKFWATNLCFGGCFPSHEQSEAVAAKLAR